MVHQIEIARGRKKSGTVEPGFSGHCTVCSLLVNNIFYHYQRAFHNWKACFIKINMLIKLLK